MANEFDRDNHSQNLVVLEVVLLTAERHICAALRNVAMSTQTALDITMQEQANELTK